MVTSRGASSPGVFNPGLFDQGLAHHRAGRLAEAEEIYRRILTADGRHADAWHLLGVIAFERGRNEAALNFIGNAIRLDDRQPAYYNNFGNALFELGHPAEAESAYSAALALDPHYAEACSNRGNALRALGRLEDSEAAYRASLRRRPNQPETHNNLGNTLQIMGREAEAEACFRKAVRLRPDYADAHSNLGHALLLRGRFAEAWPEYEWRLRTRQTALSRKLPTPRWTGAPLEGRTLLIHAEQGLGDNLQFCRYATEVAASAGGPVVLEVQAPLVRLMASLAGDMRVVGRSDVLPDHDLHCPLLSLPGVLGLTLETLPPPAPYLSVAPELVAAWTQRLSGRPGLKVGLVWAGGSRPDQPMVEAIDRRRSITLQTMAPLAQAPGVCFVSLQKDGPGQQARTPPAGMALADFTEEMGDFLDTAALIGALDLVISVDTAVAHLAGALGKPVWLLNRFDTCWRWLKDRDDSPWYAGLRQFRQPAPGDWGAVMQAVAAALTSEAAGRRLAA
ncbi:tetratricopeptide repeat protein [Phenylobacterium hankyongense]|nr:tetratricopeptide repeat protein [Phenylobacterium hankyongense]